MHPHHGQGILVQQRYREGSGGRLVQRYSSDHIRAVFPLYRDLHGDVCITSRWVVHPYHQRKV